MLPQKAIREFKEIYQKKFKEELDDNEVLDKALRVFNLYKTVYGSDNLSQKSNINQTINKNERRKNK